MFSFPCICRLDELPSRYQAASKIFLSNNSLTSVRGIQQFRGVQTLTLAHNLLGNLEEVCVCVHACLSVYVCVSIYVCVCVFSATFAWPNDQQ